MNRRDRIIATFWLTGNCAVAIGLLVVGWPVIFVPGLWKEYTCWDDEVSEIPSEVIPRE